VRTDCQLSPILTDPVTISNVEKRLIDTGFPTIGQIFAATNDSTLTKISIEIEQKAHRLSNNSFSAVC
jgi:hypothetical protein